MQPQCLLWAQQCWEQLCRNVWEATRKKKKQEQKPSEFWRRDVLKPTPF